MANPSSPEHVYSSQPNHIHDPISAPGEVCIEMANLPAYTPRANETSYVQAQYTPPVSVKKSRIYRCGSRLKDSEPLLLILVLLLMFGGLTGFITLMMYLPTKIH
ncbi:hypothetical protein BJX65DRAFT_302733 [Aspergillus insuetus]